MYTCVSYKSNFFGVKAKNLLIIAKFTGKKTDYRD